MARDCKKCKYFQGMHPRKESLQELRRKGESMTEWNKPTREYIGLED